MWDLHDLLFLFCFVLFFLKDYGWWIWQSILPENLMDVVITVMDWVCLMYKDDEDVYDYLNASEFVRKKLLVIPRTKQNAKGNEIEYNNNITAHTIHTSTTELGKLCYLYVCLHLFVSK